MSMINTGGNPTGISADLLRPPRRWTNGLLLFIVVTVVALIGWAWWPSATAAGFLVSPGRGEPSNCSPMACSTTRRAVTVKSWGVPWRLGLIRQAAPPLSVAVR